MRVMVIAAVVLVVVACWTERPQLVPYAQRVYLGLFAALPVPPVRRAAPLATAAEPNPWNR